MPLDGLGGLLSYVLFSEYDAERVSAPYRLFLCIPRESLRCARADLTAIAVQVETIWVVGVAVHLIKHKVARLDEIATCL
jgi:hypothetical protein